MIKLEPGGAYAYAIDLDYCKGCGLCVAECPCRRDRDGAGADLTFPRNVISSDHELAAAIREADAGYAQCVAKMMRFERRYVSARAAIQARGYPLHPIGRPALRTSVHTRRTAAAMGGVSAVPGA